MVPTMTVGTILGDAGLVVTEFGSLILLVVGFAVGVWGVRFVIRQIKAAKK